MNYSNIRNNGTTLKTNKSNANQLKIEQDKKETGITALKKGQRITGVVVSVGEQVTLNFNGQEVTSSKGVLSDVKPGDVKTFEVMKANGKEIELRVLNETLSAIGNTFKAVLKKDSDWESLVEQKKKNADKSEKEADNKHTKNTMHKINSLITEQDCTQLEKEGYKIEDYTVNGLYQALKRIKMQSNDQSDGNDQGDLSLPFSKDSKDLEQRLKDNNLPSTTDNLTALNKAMELSSSVQAMNDKSMKYLISTNSVPSVENIYKANYSQTTVNANTNQPLSEDAWKELRGQVGDVIKAAGFEVNEDTLKDARWLIENNLPMTSETFTYKNNLDDMKANLDQNTILNKMVQGMKEGIDPKDVSLMEENTQKAKQVVEDVQSISDEAISKAVQNDDELTINRLKTIQEGLSSVEKEDGAGENKEKVPSADELKETEVAGENRQGKEVLSKEYEELKAKRQMEEIRLKMTLDAARQLDKQGIEVDTQSLEKVVEELRRLEESYHYKLLQEGDVEPTPSAVQMLKDTTDSIEALKLMPCSVLGSTLDNGGTQTIPDILTEGNKLQSEYAKAGAAYETLSTVVNAEYGDSIKKAFANADALLNQMGLEGNEQNRRAVRILGYNQMEITEDNIQRVKAYDAQVTGLIQNMNPATTVRMIKQGMNPLDMTISELNKTVDQMKEEQGLNSEDKYSVYLNKLVKQNGITAEERKAYIGIYRLLYNIEKSDGAVLGSVIKANREVTLSSLLTAIQTSKKGSLDAIINDEFGTLQSITQNKESISSQLSSFTGDGSQAKHDQAQNGVTMEEQTEYIDRILKQLKDELTPGKLMEASNRLKQSGMGKSKPSASTPQLSSDKGVWEAIKEVPVEKLMEQLRSTSDDLADENYATKVNEIRELCKNAEQSIRFLKDYRMPTTPANISMANQMLSNGEASIKKQLKLEKERNVEKSENDIKNSDDLSDKLVDKQSMQEAYEQLDTDAKSALVQACSGEQIDSQKLAQLKSIGQQMTFAKTLAEREFYQIPIETDKGITNMNLTILRGAKESGRVSISVWSKQLGNVKAEFALKEDKLKGFVGSDNKDGLERLQSNMSEIDNAAREYNITIKQMDYGVLQRDNDTYSDLNTTSEETQATISADTERILYRVAKAMVQTVRMAENSEAGGNRAVS